MFVETACGFVAIAESNGFTAPFTLTADFAAPSGNYATFDTRTVHPGELAPVAWPYDGESVAMLLSNATDPFTPGPSTLDVVRPSGLTQFQIDSGGTLLATPLLSSS